MTHSPYLGLGGGVQNVTKFNWFNEQRKLVPYKEVTLF